MEEFDNRVSWVKFIPFHREIRTVGQLVVVVLEQFSQHQDIQKQGVLGLVIVVKVGIAILVPTPVDNGAMNRAHQKVDRE